MTAARDCALGAAILGSQAGYHVVGAPWWTGFALATFVLLTACLRIVFPQNSSDRLAWWRDHRRTRRPRGTKNGGAATDGAAKNGAATNERCCKERCCKERFCEEQWREEQWREAWCEEQVDRSKHRQDGLPGSAS
jgi:hypothetical protein